MKLLFATANKNKLREAAEILGDMVQVISPSELNINADVEETGETLQDNSILKARTLYDLSGLDCFADDTGLEVEVLNGAPGVLTARYAACFPGGALPHDSEANMNRLLEELSEYSTPESRRARFRTVITLIYEGRQYCFEGIVSGTIAQGKAGNGGFGYDPIFIPDGFGGRTMAEISEDEKNAISHRGRALRAMAEFLSTVREDY
ncbi:MAG: RdgB/HAM1 family non-canonical purine NTP pyrophosphatase [Bacteroides sp.]|nr:RdgB/HAM1 family non-canonical purine NTP pyrophosphatase [Bacteroidales bacterium]MCI6680576.1 RdgB/HAM1 family non-canonical purine NTP pyrophosphatase [Bacteroides sp.]MDD7489803.1 RdgB/HAM1 family non-canonical purine NTP pyrophosphatase [Bacteroides sp.]MDY5891767.1 RdgB/HAM1 family non-canonical purine NTP pyrophosphatase [Candidatus Cryptobacteroides sp.]